jgi:MFS family permease
MTIEAPAELGNHVDASAAFWRATLTVFLPFAGGYYLSYFFRTINALISGRLVAEFDLTATQIGLLTSVYFLSAIVQLPLGAMVDRYGPRRCQGVLLLIAAAGAALFATAGGFWALLFGRALIGVGAGAAVICGFKAIVLWFPKERVALMNGCFVMLGALGAVTATTPAERVVASTGWPGMFDLLAALTAACGVITLILVPETTPAATISCPKTMNLRDLLRDRRFWRLAPLSTMCISTAWALQGLWAAPWLQDVEHLDHEAIVRHLFVMALALSAGSLLLGLCAHGLRRRGVRAQDVLTIASIVFITAEVALICGLQVSSYVLWAVIASLGGASVLTYAIIAEYFPTGMIGKANAALSTCHIGGTLVLQYAIGVVIDSWVGHAGHYPPIAHRTAFAIVVVMQVAALAWFACSDRAFAGKFVVPKAVAIRPRDAESG